MELMKDRLGVLGLLFVVVFGSLLDYGFIWCSQPFGQDFFVFVLVASVLFLAGILISISSIFQLRKAKENKKANSLSWSLMAVIAILVFALLLYAGVECPPPDVCVMPTGIGCEKPILHADGGIMELTLSNEFGKPIVVTSVTCTKKPDQFIRLVNETMQAGQRASFLINCNDENGGLIDNFSPGESVIGRINVEYHFEEEGSGVPRTISGNIYVRAE